MTKTVSLDRWDVDARLSSEQESLLQALADAAASSAATAAAAETTTTTVTTRAAASPASRNNADVDVDDATDTAFDAMLKQLGAY
jgi:hypothetical protein